MHSLPDYWRLLGLQREHGPLHGWLCCWHGPRCYCRIWLCRLLHLLRKLQRVRCHWLHRLCVGLHSQRRYLRGALRCGYLPRRQRLRTLLCWLRTVHELGTQRGCVPTVRYRLLQGCRKRVHSVRCWKQLVHRLQRGRHLHGRLCRRLSAQ